MGALAVPDDEEETDDVLKLEHEIAGIDRDTIRYKQELTSLQDSFNVETEALEHVQDRVTSVTSELNAVMSGEQTITHTEDDQQLGTLSTLRDLTPMVTASFRTAVRDRLSDMDNMSALASRGATGTAAYVRVHWGKQHCDWKSMDTMDGTEITFAALLHDVARYWGVPSDELALCHEDGAVWPLEAYVASEMRNVATPEAATGRTASHVWLKRRPLAEVGKYKPLDVDWETGGDNMSPAERRKLEREERERRANLGRRKSKKVEAEEERQALLVDLLKYVVFISLYMFVLYSRRSVRESFELVQTLRAVFVEENFGDYNEKAYMDIATIGEFYEWAQGPFTEGLLPAELYDGSPVTEQRVMYYNKVVGGVRLRQNRIRGDSCDIGISVQEEFTPTRGPTEGILQKRSFVDLDMCYYRYKPAFMSTDAYSVANGTDDTSDPNINAFRWRSPMENDLPDTYLFTGQFGFYDGGGFVLDIVNLTTVSLVESLDFLKEMDWLDRNTRSISMTVLAYNANYNLYALSSFFLELSPAGVMAPSFTMKTVKMDMFVNEEDLVYTIFEGVLYVYFLYYIWVEGSELYETCRQTGSIKGYISDAWNVADWVVIIVSFVALAMRLQFFFDEKVRGFDAFTKEYVELSAVAALFEMSFSIDSFAAYLALMKLFKFFGLQRNLLILRSTIVRALTDLSVFSIVMCIFLFAFTISGNQIFGQENEEYVNVFKCFITLFQMGFLGEFDFDGIARVNYGVALVYFWAFQFLIFFIIVNIFLAILNDAYIAVNEQFAGVEDEVREHVTIRERIRRLKAAIRQRKMDQNIEALRAVHRRREMTERREERKREDDRMRVLKSMGQGNATKKGATTTTRGASAAVSGAVPAAAAAAAPMAAAAEDATEPLPPQDGEEEARSDEEVQEAEQLL